MGQTPRFNEIVPPPGRRACPKCGLPLVLGVIESSDKPEEDERIYECAVCAYAETVTPLVSRS
jgi:hypothetical protein